MRLNRAISPLEHVIYGHYKVVHGVRMALAFVLTFLAIRLLHVPEATWPLITMVVVMGPISFWGTCLLVRCNALWELYSVQPLG